MMEYRMSIHSPDTNLQRKYRYSRKQDYLGREVQDDSEKTG